MATVVRDLEEPLRNRLGRDHLPPRRDDQAFELPEEPARIAVGRDDDGLGVRLLDGFDPRVLVDLDAGGHGERSDPPNETRGLKHAVRWMEDRGRVPLRERRRQLVVPFDREAVGPECGVLLFELRPFLIVRRDAKAPGGAKRVAGDCRELP